MPTRPGLHVGCVLPFHATGCPDWVPEGTTFEEADAQRQRRLAGRSRHEHLRDHLTDGRWHDSCPYCLDRREHGGTGVPASTATGTERKD